MNKDKEKYLSLNGLFIRFTHLEVNKEIEKTIFLYNKEYMIGHFNAHTLRLDYINKSGDWLSYTIRRGD